MGRRLASAILLGFVGATGVARAADLPLPSRPMPVYAPAPLPTFSWSGFYAGVNAGYAFDNVSRVSLTGATPANANNIGTYAVPGTPTIHDDGFTAGGQIGFNYELKGTLTGSGGVVVGLEADAAYTDLDRTVNDPTPRNADRLFTSQLEFLGTIRGRLGYAFDRFLVYGTGGFAYGYADDGVALLDRTTNTITRFAGRQTDLVAGYAAGGGIEYALPTESFMNVFGANAVTLKLEYLHYDLGTADVRAEPNLDTNATGAYNARFAFNGNLVRAGINYKF